MWEGGEHVIVKRLECANERERERGGGGGAGGRSMQGGELVVVVV